MQSLDLADSYPSSISSAKIAALCQVLRDEGSIKHPASACLSPAGEYNMRLGVRVVYYFVIVSIILVIVSLIECVCLSRC